MDASILSNIDWKQVVAIQKSMFGMVILTSHLITFKSVLHVSKRASAAKLDLLLITWRST